MRKKRRLAFIFSKADSFSSRKYLSFQVRILQPSLTPLHNLDQILIIYMQNAGPAQLSNLEATYTRAHLAPFMHPTKDTRLSIVRFFRVEIEATKPLELRREWKPGRQHFFLQMNHHLNLSRLCFSLPLRVCCLSLT